MKLEKGQVAVVTGGASGIGFALARRFAQEGLAIVLADVERSALDRAVGELRSAGAEADGHVTDVRDPEAMEALAHAVWKRNRRVDVLCNNAGVATLGRIADQSLADWEWVMGVNFWGVLNGIRAVPAATPGRRPARSHRQYRLARRSRRRPDARALLRLEARRGLAVGVPAP